jgi:gluconate 5-dehydrogenase
MNYKKIFDLTGKVSVITGGYGHLGAEMTRVLMAWGSTVVVAGRSVEKFKTVFSKEEQEKLEYEPIDITDTERVETCVDHILSKHGRIDVLVNNAHTAKGKSPDCMSDEDWAYTMEGVVGSAHRMIRSVMPILRTQQTGKIINIASMYGLVSPDFRLYDGDNCEKYANPPHYGAAKAAMIQLTKYYAVYLGKENVQVNAIAPGPFPAEVIQKENPDFVERLKQRNPLQKIGRPEDLAGVLALLASNASDFITGQVLQVDGGWTAW